MNADGIDDEPEKKRTVGEFAAALAVAFFHEFTGVHHQSSITRRVLIALVTALPLAVLAHFGRNKKKQINWKNVEIFVASCALALLIEWHRVGSGTPFSHVLSDSFTIGVWIAATVILFTYMWQQAEGQTE